MQNCPISGVEDVKGSQLFPFQTMGSEDAAYYDLVKIKIKLNIPLQKIIKGYYNADEAIRKSVHEYYWKNQYS